MSGDSKELKVEILGKQVVFHGDSRDAYFAALPVHLSALGPLLKYATTDLPPDAVCLDVGANIGLASIVLALSCPRGHVYAFEPSPRSFRYLKLNIEANQLRNITAVPVALGGYTGEVAFNDAEFAAGSHVVDRVPALPASNLTGVRMTTIDSFVRERVWPHDAIDMIKIDVEGFEPGVIAGASETLLKFACPMMIEFNTWCLEAFHGYDAWAFCRALHASFDVFAADTSGDWVVSQGGAYGMMHRNWIERHCVEDVLLKPKRGVRLPTFPEMTRSTVEQELEAEVARLRAKVEKLGRRNMTAGETLFARATRYLGRLRSV